MMHSVFYFLIALSAISFRFYDDVTIDMDEDHQKEYDSLIDSAMLYSGTEKAMYYLRKADSLADVYDIDTTWKADIILGWDMIRKQQVDSVKMKIEEVVKKDYELTDEESELLYLYEMGHLYLNSIQYIQADENFIKLLNLAREYSNEKYISQAYQGRALVSVYNHDYKKSNAYLDLLFDELGDGDFFHKGNALERYIENFSNLRELDKGIQKSKEAINYYKKIGDTNRLPFVYGRMAWIQKEKGLIDSAAQTYRRLLETSNKENNAYLMLDAKVNMGHICLNKKEYQEAISNYKSAIKLSERFDNPPSIILYAYYHLSIAYDSLKQYKQAYDYYRLFSTRKDSVRQAEIEQLYVTERTRFESKQKEQQLEILSLNFQRNRYYLFSSIGFTILLILVIVLLFRQQKLKSQKKIADFKKQLSEFKQINLRQRMNPHFVFNTLNSIQYYMFQNDKEATNLYMSKFALLIRKILENSQNNSVPIKYEIETLRLYIDLEQLRFKDRFSYRINIDDEIDELQYKIPTMIIQPYVENAINHGLYSIEKGGELHIDLKLLNSKKIECIIEDNGVGREQAAMIRQQKDSGHQSLGTSITQERLRLINTISGNQLSVETIDLKNDKGRPEGTRVVIQIPILS